LETLLEVRSVLESQIPQGCSWPDFYITEDVLDGLPFFADQAKEADLAGKYAWETSKKPGAFDRCGEQTRWLRNVFGQFAVPLFQQQAYELERAWWDYQVRRKDEDKVCTKLLDDGVSGHSTPISPQATPVVDGGVIPDSIAGTSEDAAPLPPPFPPPRPATPRGLPTKSTPGAVSVRQLLSYMCVGSSLEDGLTRAAAVLGPSSCSAETAVPAAIFHALLFQLGARPAPPSIDGDGRPWQLSVDMLCKEMDLDNSGGEASISVKDFVASPQLGRLNSRFAFGRKHSRGEVEKLFPKNLTAGAKVLANQRVQA
jgi:hypothetical protein